MQRMAFLMAIRPGTEVEYDQRHRAVWADMLAELRTAGFHTSSRFRQGTQVFASLERTDLARYQQYLAANPIAARWEAFMSDILIRDSDPATGFPPLLSEVFHLANQEHHV